MISLEFLLVFTIVVVPLFLGLLMLGRKLVTLYLDRTAAMEQPFARPVVWDSTGAPGNKPLGAVIGYDRFSAPMVLWRDNTTPFTGLLYKPGVLLGVRPTRFTTDSVVYYTDNTCSVGPMVRSAASSTSWPSAGFISQMQTLNYAVGNGNVLYHQPHPAVAGGVQAALSVWISQDTRDNSPATGGTACVSSFEITSAVTDDLVNGNLATVTITTDIPHHLETLDTVLIQNCGTLGAVLGVCAAPLPVAVIGPHSFKIIAPIPSAVTAPGAPITPATLTILSAQLITTINLVGATGVDLDAAPNFTTPFRLAFPANVPIAPLGPSTGG